MWQRAYLYRLKRDIDLWIERGWVTPANAEAILKQAEEKPSARRMPAILAILGAVLIGFAVMSFVAANWRRRCLSEGPTSIPKNVYAQKRGVQKP